MRLMVVVLMVTACADPTLTPEGGPCTPKFEGEVSTCAGDLFCSPVTSHCIRRAVEGEACGGDAKTPCADPLICNHDQTCQPLAPAGAVCGLTLECATGLACNHGYLPDDVSLGECHALGQVGEPCFYGQYVQGGGGGIGCFPGLTCVPTTTPSLLSIYTFPIDVGCTIASVDPACGYPGVCQVPGGVPMGAGCLDAAAACADGGTCYPQPQPWADDLAPGFACVGNDDCYLGPWPGLCGPGGAPSAPVEGQDCETTPCAPGYLCDWLHTCRPRFHGGLLARCDTWGTGAPDDEFCMIGRHCAGAPAECVIGAPL